MAATAEAALRTFIGRVQAKFPSAGEDFDEEKVRRALCAAGRRPRRCGIGPVDDDAVAELGMGSSG